MEGEGHGKAPPFLVPRGDLAVPAAELQEDLRRTVLLPAQLQDLREGQLRGRLAALPRRRPVDEGHREDALDEALPADALALADQRLTAEAQDLRRPLLPRGEGPGVREGEILLGHGGEKTGLLDLLPFFQPGLRRRRNVRGKTQGCRTAGPQPDRQAAAGEDLPGVRQAVFQALQFRLRQKAHSVPHSLRLGPEGQGEPQAPDAALPLRDIEQRHPDHAAHLCPPAGDLPPVEEDPALPIDDPGDVRAGIRHDGLCRLLLGDDLLRPDGKGVQGVFLPFQLHCSNRPFPLVCPAASLFRSCPRYAGKKRNGRFRGHPSSTRKSLRSRPRRALGDFQTTILMDPSPFSGVGSSRSRRR